MSINKSISINKDSQGSIIVSIMMITAFLVTIIFSLLVLSNSSLVRARSRLLQLQAQYSAESGADSAVAYLNSIGDSYTGTTAEVTVLTNTLYRATYTVSVTAGSQANEKVITATGKVYSPARETQSQNTRTLKIIAQRGSSNTASSMLSRNIINIESGVKNIKAKSIFTNGYIQMNKNTTSLIAENITVADKYTDASNCSIFGSGNLVKPPAFTTAGQTKTNVVTRYNNCISPPGNSSNTNFNVSANNSNISKVGSTYIPVSQYMDSSYQNSPGACTDWTTGSFPRNIPSVGNTKKTHYPDSGSNISSSCGSSGDLTLQSGQYNIKDNVHLRASLCATSGCSPTFYNPDQGPTGVKYIFVEGSINFDSVQTATGSGPIVIVNYGADPASKTGSCPLGGSFYVGSSGNTSAPNLYLFSINGVCLDKTKFGSDPALGGIAGKNLYVATNPGTPFDLELDNSFPTEQIPIDLSWRAIRYQRL